MGTGYVKSSFVMRHIGLRIFNYYGTQMTDISLLAEMIQARYRYAKRPSNEEVKQILVDLRRFKLAGKLIDEDVLHEVIRGHLKDKRVIVLDSLDMSPIVSILKQMMVAVQQQRTT
jgi:archaellum biogenesis ATPase FlaH